MLTDKGRKSKSGRRGWGIERAGKLTPQKDAIVDDGFLPNRNSLPSRPAGLHVLLITLRHLVPQNYMLPNGLLMVIGFSAL